MRLEKYINEYSYLGEYLSLMESICINEMTDDTFSVIRRLGSKVGLKVKKSNTIFDYLKKSRRGMGELLKYASLYGMTDIKDKETRAKLVDNMRDTLKKVNKRDVTAFFMQLDRSLLSLTSIPRHILMSLFGIEVTTFNKWIDDIEYIKKELRHVKVVLNRIGDMDKEIEVVNNLENILTKRIKEKS